MEAVNPHSSAYHTNKKCHALAFNDERVEDHIKHPCSIFIHMYACHYVFMYAHTTLMRIPAEPRVELSPTLELQLR